MVSVPYVSSDRRTSNAECHRPFVQALPALDNGEYKVEQVMPNNLNRMKFVCKWLIAILAVAATQSSREPVLWTPKVKTREKSICAANNPFPSLESLKIRRTRAKFS